MKSQISLWVAAILVVVATNGLQAQTYHYPPNPDFNHDGYVNAQDLLDFLPFYETQWGPLADYEAPDYEFADFQQAVYDVWNENHTLDSLYLHFTLESYHEWYPVGDTTLHADTISYSRTLVLVEQNNNYQGTEVSWRANTTDGNVMINLWHYGEDSGYYRIDIIDNTTTRAYLNSIGFLSGNRQVRDWHITETEWAEWTMDEAGWHHNMPTIMGQTVTEFECIPYFSTPN